MKRSLKIITVFVVGFALLAAPHLLYAKSGESPGVIDINEGDVVALSTLPGIGESTAEKIIQYRTEHGKFKKKEDITKVKGISSKKFDKIKDLIAVSDEGTAKPKQEK